MRMQLAVLIAAESEAVDARARHIEADAAAQERAGRTQAEQRSTRNNAKRWLKELLTPVETLALASEIKDKVKLKKRIQGEHRYSVRVVCMVEQFGLGVVAFRGAILMEEKYV